MIIEYCIWQKILNFDYKSRRKSFAGADKAAAGALQRHSNNELD